MNKTCKPCFHYTVLLSYSLPSSVNESVCTRWTVFMYPRCTLHISKSSHLSLFRKRFPDIEHTSANKLRGHFDKIHPLVLKINERQLVFTVKDSNLRVLQSPLLHVLVHTAIFTHKCVFNNGRMYRNIQHC
jgi:hypothetical protein